MWKVWLKFAPRFICKAGTCHWRGADSAVQCEGSRLSSLSTQVSQPMSSCWCALATGSCELIKSPLLSLSLALMLSGSLLSSFSHTELIRENKRAELISAGLPGESKAISAIDNIFIQPTPLCAFRWALSKVIEWVGVQRHKKHIVLIQDELGLVMWVWLIGCSLPTLANGAAKLFL